MCTAQVGFLQGVCVPAWFGRTGIARYIPPDFVQERRKKAEERCEQKVANNPYTLLKKEVDHVKELETQVENLKLKWTRELPSKVGWYWMRKARWTKFDFECVPVYLFEGRLSFKDFYVEDFEDKENYEWAGPIPVPEG